MQTVRQSSGAGQRLAAAVLSRPDHAVLAPVHARGEPDDGHDHGHAHRHAEGEARIHPHLHPHSGEHGKIAPEGEGGVTLLGLSAPLRAGFALGLAGLAVTAVGLVVAGW